jgi:ribosomal-protein-alanine N-acetyltransferase
VKIREAVPEDVPQLFLLEQACFGDPWSQKSLRDTLNEEHSFFAVAEEDGRIYGYLNTTYVLDEMNLNRICVLPEYRRSGVGSALMQQMFTCAQQRQIRALYLEVRESNENAQRVYRRFGFQVVGRRAGFYQNPTEAGLVMSASVSANGKESI